MSDIKTRFFQLEKEVEQHSQENEKLNAWINSSLKPGLANLKSAIKNRLDQFEGQLELEPSVELIASLDDLDIERNKTAELARWIQENLGTHREV